MHSKIKYYTAIKVGFLLLFSMFQIWTTTSVLQNVRVVNRIYVKSDMPGDENIIL